MGFCTSNFFDHFSSHNLDHFFFFLFLFLLSNLCLNHNRLFATNPEKSLMYNCVISGVILLFVANDFLSSCASLILALVSFDQFISNFISDFLSCCPLLMLALISFDQFICNFTLHVLIITIYLRSTFKLYLFCMFFYGVNMLS